MQVIKGHQDYVNKVFFNEERNIVISCSNDKTLRIWKRNTTFFEDSDPIQSFLPKLIYFENKAYMFKKRIFEQLLLFLSEDYSEYVIHGALNILYMLVLSGHHDLLLKALTTFGYKSPYYRQDF